MEIPKSDAVLRVCPVLIQRLGTVDGKATLNLHLGCISISVGFLVKGPGELCQPGHLDQCCTCDVAK